MKASCRTLDAFAERLRGGHSREPVLVVVAHPDDETLGIGGHLPGLGLVEIVQLTDGAPRNGDDARANGFADWQAYAEARRQEVQAALEELGVDQHRCFCIPDQEASANMAELARRLRALIEEKDPAFVCTHAYEGGHPDHDATAFFVHAACRLVDRSGPMVIEMPFYHLGADGPVRQSFVPHGPGAELAVELTAETWQRKRHAIALFTTQAGTLRPFRSQTERFRVAPAYDFDALPNGGRLLYEEFGWGFTGSDFLALARAATRELGLRGRWH